MMKRGLNIYPVKKDEQKESRKSEEKEKVCISSRTGELIIKIRCSYIKKNHTKYTNHAQTKIKK